MTKIDENLISKLEKLSKLRLNPEEKKQIRKDLEGIVKMFDKLQEVSTDDVHPTRHISVQEHPLRKDLPANELNAEQALVNAPDTYREFIAVPKFLKPK